MLKCIKSDDRFVMGDTITVLCIVLETLVTRHFLLLLLLYYLGIFVERYKKKVSVPSYLISCVRIIRQNKARSRYFIIIDYMLLKNN